MADTQLLPCPFCGSEHVALIHNTSSDHRYDWDFAVECECGAKGESDKSEEHAAIVWNRRAALASRPAEVDYLTCDLCKGTGETKTRALGAVWHHTCARCKGKGVAPSHTTNKENG